MIRIKYSLHMMTSISTYHWGIGTPGPTCDRQRSQTVASTSLLLCGCERQSFLYFISSFRLCTMARYKCIDWL